MSVKALQQEVNRFANDVNIGFEPIPCDDATGPMTLAATLMALTTIQLSSTDASLAQQAGERIAGLNTPADLTTQANSLTQLVAAGAFSLGLGYIECPKPSLIKLAAYLPKPTSAKSAAMLATIKDSKPALAGLFGLGLPSWAVYSGGAALALALTMLIVKRKKTSSNIAGRGW